MAMETDMDISSPLAVARGRGEVVRGWYLFARAVEAYCRGSKTSYYETGVPEVLESLRTGRKPDLQLSVNAHYTLTALLNPDLDNPGEFFPSSVTYQEFENIFYLHTCMMTVGNEAGDLNKLWPLIPAESVWPKLTRMEQEFMKTFTVLETMYGEVPFETLVQFRPDKGDRTGKMGRHLLGMLTEKGLISPKMPTRGLVYEGSPENPAFLLGDY